MFSSLRSQLYAILRKSEKYTKTDMIYLVKNSTFLSLGYFFSLISMLALAIIYANFLPKEILGTYKFIISIIGILSISTLSGMDTALITSVAKGYENSIKIALTTKIRYGLLGAIACLFIAGYYYINKNNMLAFSMLIATPFIPFFSSVTIYNSLLAGKKEFKISTKYKITQNIISTIIITTVIFFTNNIFYLIAAYLTTNTLLNFYYLKRSLSKIKINSKIDSGMVNYGKHLSLMNLSNTLIMHIDKILIFHFLGAQQLATYVIAITPVELIKGVFKSIGILALPKFSKRSKKLLLKQLSTKRKQLSVAVTLISTIYIVIAPTFFKIIFNQYTNSALFYSQVFALSLIPAAAYINNSYLQAKTLKKELYVFNLTSSSLQICMLLILGYYFGLMGIIVSKILQRFFSLFFSSYLIEKSV